MRKIKHKYIILDWYGGRHATIKAENSELALEMYLGKNLKEFKGRPTDWMVVREQDIRIFKLNIAANL